MRKTGRERERERERVLLRLHGKYTYAFHGCPFHSQKIVFTDSSRSVNKCNNQLSRASICGLSSIKAVRSCDSRQQSLDLTIDKKYVFNCFVSVLANTKFCHFINWAANSLFCLFDWLIKRNLNTESKRFFKTRSNN